MTRDWTDMDGRTWRVSASDPVLEGEPYLIEFSHGSEKHRTEYAGGRTLDQLTGEELEELLGQTTD